MGLNPETVEPREGPSTEKVYMLLAKRAKEFHFSYSAIKSQRSQHLVGWLARQCFTGFSCKHPKLATARLIPFTLGWYV